MNLSFYTFTSPLVFELVGKDAVRYLHNRLTNNIRQLAVGKTCRAAALSPQGKTQGFFHVARIEEEKFFLVSSGGDDAIVQAELLRFKVADRLDCISHSAQRTIIHLSGEKEALQREWQSFSLGDELPQDNACLLNGDSLVFRVNRISSSFEIGLDIVCSHEESSTLQNKLLNRKVKQLSLSEFTARRIQRGIPSFPEELNDRLLFSESQFLEAVSFTKGCYVGQEVVEKADAHGRLPRLLTRLELNGEFKFDAGHPVLEGDDRVGKVLSSGYLEDRGMTYVFASIDSEFRDSVNLSLAGNIVTIVK